MLKSDGMQGGDTICMTLPDCYWYTQEQLENMPVIRLENGQSGWEVRYDDGRTRILVKRRETGKYAGKFHVEVYSFDGVKWWYLSRYWAK